MSMKKLIGGAVRRRHVARHVRRCLGQRRAGSERHNDHGLCTAYYNGQKNGHDKDGEAGADHSPAFQGLEAAGSDQDGDNGGDDAAAQLAANVYEHCNGLIGGNTDHGRWTCYLNDNNEDGTTGETEYYCENNPAPGNSGNAHGGA